MIVNQLPAKGVPNRPTAISIQIKTNTSINKVINKNLLLLFPVFLRMKSIPNPLESNNIPITIKSNTDQFTSGENCMNTNGINSNTNTEPRISFCLLRTISKNK